MEHIWQILDFGVNEGGLIERGAFFELDFEKSDLLARGLDREGA